LLYGEEVVEGQFDPVGFAYPFFEGHKGMKKAVYGLEFMVWGC
jgi:hypothetical protein